MLDRQGNANQTGTLVSGQVIPTGLLAQELVVSTNTVLRRTSLCRNFQSELLSENTPREGGATISGRLHREG